MKSHDYVVRSPAPFYPHSREREMNRTKPGLSLLRAMCTENFQTNKKGCQRHCSAWTFSKLTFKTHARNGKKNNADSLSSFETAARVIDVCVCSRRAGAVICLPRCFPCHFHGKLDGIGPRGREKNHPVPAYCQDCAHAKYGSWHLRENCNSAVVNNAAPKSRRNGIWKMSSIWWMNLIKYNPLPPHRVTVMPNAKFSTASVQRGPRYLMPTMVVLHPKLHCRKKNYRLTVFFLSKYKQLPAVEATEEN